MLQQKCYLRKVRVRQHEGKSYLAHHCRRVLVLLPGLRKARQRWRQSVWPSCWANLHSQVHRVSSDPTAVPPERRTISLRGLRAISKCARFTTPCNTSDDLHRRPAPVSRCGIAWWQMNVGCTSLALSVYTLVMPFIPRMM